MFHGGQRTAAALVANRRSREFLEERRVCYDMKRGCWPNGCSQNCHDRMLSVSAA